MSLRTRTPLPLSALPPHASLTRAIVQTLVVAAVCTNAAHSAEGGSGADPASKTLPIINVQGTAPLEHTATSPVEGYVAERSYASTMTDTPLEEIPRSISVIGAEQLTDQGSQTLQDALRYTAGVRHEAFGLYNLSDEFTVRGASAQTMLDGLRVQSYGSYSKMRFDPFVFERIEILKGPTAVAGGANPPGGLASLVSKRPQLESKHEVTAQAGSYSHKYLAVDSTGAIDRDGRWLYRVVALGKDAGTQVDHTIDRRVLFRPSVTWLPDSTTRVTGFAHYQKDKNNATSGFFPRIGTLYSGPNGKIPTSRFIGEPSWDGNQITTKQVGWMIEKDLGDVWSVRHNLRHEVSRSNYLAAYSHFFEGYQDAEGNPDPAGKYLNRSRYGGMESVQATAANLYGEAKFSTGRIKHRLLLGTNYGRIRDHYNYRDDSLTPLNVFDPAYGNTPTPSMVGAEDTFVRSSSWGAMIQDQMKIDDRFIVGAGLRRDEASTRTNQDLQKDKAVTGNLGAVWLAGNGFSPYASYAQSFEPVIGFRAFDGRQFKPKEGAQTEAGVRWQSDDRRLTSRVAAYRLRETNRTVADPDHENFSLQYGEVKGSGLEVEMAARLRQWDVIAQYSRTNIRVSKSGTGDEASVGAQLQGEPKNAASLWAVRRFVDAGLPNLRAGLGIRFVGETGEGKRSDVKVPDLTLLDTLIAYETRSWKFSLNINNLTDKSYVAICRGRGDCWFGSRRKAIASLTYRW